MELEPRQLQHFLTVVDEGSIAAAAARSRRIRLTAPAPRDRQIYRWAGSAGPALMVSDARAAEG